MENFLLPSPRVWQNHKQLRNWVWWWEESGNTTHLDGTSSSICTFPFNLIYTTLIPEGHIRCLPFRAARGKIMETAAAAAQDPQFLSATPGGWAFHPGKWRRGGIEAGCSDARGKALAFLELCVMLEWPRFNPNWWAWQMEGALPLWRASEGLQGSRAGRPRGQGTVAGDPQCVISSWAPDEVRQETDKWPCLVNTAVVSAVITQHMGT